MRRMLRNMVLPLALVTGGVAVGTVVDSLQSPIPAVDAQRGARVTPPASAQDLASAFREASQAALPGVVYVEVESVREGSAQAERFRGTPFEEFFRHHPQASPESVPRSGSGSGFIIRPDGYVLTNNHVVEGATQVTVTLTDKREFDAQVVGRDPNTDVAVLKLNAQDLPVVAMGSAKELMVGDWVLALGYPLSLGETVTAGIVSAKGRSINILGQNRGASAPLEHFIQTDAAINPGNSGGPLVNLRGEVVGINSAIASPTGLYSGYGFAVPIGLARRVAEDLIEHGAVRRPKLGVQIKDVEPADVEVFRLPSARGAVVSSLPEGPAREAGLEMGDVIVALEGEPIQDTGDLMERVALKQPGDRVRLEVVRYGERKRFEVRLVTFDLGEGEAARVRPAQNASTPEERLGFEALPLSAELASRLNLASAGGGVIVARVNPRGPAPPTLMGVRLERINGREVRSVEDVQAVAESLRPGSTVSVIGVQPDGSRVIQNYRVRR